MNNPLRTLIPLFFSLALLFALLFALPHPGPAVRAIDAGDAIGDPTATAEPTMTQSPTATPTLQAAQFLPQIPLTRPPAITLERAWTSDSEGNAQQAFLPGDALAFRTEGTLALSSPVSVTMSLERNGPCGQGTVYSDTVEVQPGIWGHGVSSQALDCTGIYTTTTLAAYENLSPTLTTEYVVNQPSTIVISEQAGFDRCAAPSLEKMQAWWDDSPYSVFNLYIGGVSFACPNQDLDAVWVYRASQQGWRFILTWVGPQAPCTGYDHRMSWNAADAFQEGRIEAAAAAVAARRLGFFGNQVLYYDVEAFGSHASSTCRKAVRSFMQGWAEQLHDLGMKAGGYGSCYSYLSEWATNSPAPDDVWIANWIRPSYDPDITVWDAPCLSNDLWDNHERIKQYTGGHTEVWGGVSMSLDSNVLDGEITALPVQTAASPGEVRDVQLTVRGSPLRQMGLFEPGKGWLLAGDQLLATGDNGARWNRIAVPFTSVLDAAFLEPENIWTVGYNRNDPALQIATSADGGRTWQVRPVTPPAEMLTGVIGRASLEVLETGAVWLVLEEISSSSFRPAHLYFTADGGLTWQHRSLPVGGEIRFLDESQGWLAGGPAEDQLYFTHDGGLTWEKVDLQIPGSSELVSVGLPIFEDEDLGWLPVVVQEDGHETMVYYRRQDGDRSWELDGVMAAQPQVELPLGNGIKGRGSGIAEWPKGAQSTAFVDQSHGWAIVQSGNCSGEKLIPPVGSGPDDLFSCILSWYLLATGDGGRTWQSIGPE